MTQLPLLIRYWKERQQPHPPIPLLSWDEALHNTIFYLEKLERDKGGQK